MLSLLLADTAVGERERLRQAGLPRSTYHAARRRAYAEGWLKDRYIPSPTLLGYPEVTIAVMRPFADRVNALADRWLGEAGHVHQWVGTQFALGVFFHRSARERALAERRLTSPEFGTPMNLLHPRVEEGGCPVYFDYEGIWSHLSEHAGTRAYPKGLPRRPVAVPEGKDPWTPRNRWANRELLRRPFALEAADRSGHLVGPFGVPFAQQRLLKEGWVIHRVLAEPARIPGYRDRQLDRVVLITGTLRPAVGPESLFFSLTRECRVFPFLYVVDSGRILLGSLGQSPGAAARAPGGAPERRPVMATLREALEGIQVAEEPAPTLFSRLDHRYDRLAPPGEPPASAAAPEASPRDGDGDPDRAARVLVESRL